MAYNLPSDSLITDFDESAETRISEAIGIKMVMLGKVWQETVLNQQGVINFTEGVASANWYIHRLYKLGQTGIGQPDSNKSFLFGEQNTEFGQFGRRAKWRTVSMDPNNVPKARHARLTIPMMAQQYMLTKSIGESLYQTNPAYKGDIESDIYMDFAHGVARDQCLYWYTSQNNGYQFCTVSSGAWVTRNTTEDTFQFQTSNEAIERFNENMVVDFRYESDPDGSGSLADEGLINDGYIGYVTAVDITSNTVEVQFLNSSDTVATGSGGANSAFTIGDGSRVCPYNNYDDANSQYMGVAGINSYQKSSGTLLDDESVGTSGAGKIPLDDYPQLRSVEKAVNGSLTPDILRQWVGLADRAGARINGYGMDTIFTTEGVLRQACSDQTAYHLNLNQGPIGGAITADGNCGYTFSMNGKTYKIIADPWVEAGTLYGTKLGQNNWKRAVPEDLTGFRSAPSIPTQIPFRFIAEWYGLPDERIPIYDSSAAGNYNRLTEGIQMPGIVRYQVCPDNPVGLKLTSLTEDNDFQDALAS